MTHEAKSALFKPLYEWCFINNIRPHLALNVDAETDDEFMTKNISLEEFKKFLNDDHNYKVNSLPRKPEKFLELRMYGLVPYNISDIQKGIQFGHAVARYGREYGNQVLDAPTCEYIRWVDNWETFIILNGGTSNEGNLVLQGYKDFIYYGTMQEHLTELVGNDIKVSRFYEPDLNSMLSAICFLVDERVFDTKTYPDFQMSPLMDDYTVEDFNKWQSDNEFQRTKWVEKIGGPKNAFLRSFLVGKRLA